MTAPTENLSLWKSVEKTDPGATKSFSRSGGFKGTAVSPMWLIKRATEQWGPMGREWGIRIVSQEVIEGAPITAADGQVVGCERLHTILAELYYPGGAVPCIGQTMLVGKNKYGAFTDEEAPKKSLTDALTKGLSWLGFAADVHMGLFDDVKYVNEVREEFHLQQLREQTLATLWRAAKTGEKPTRTLIAALSKEARAAVEDDLEGVLEKARQADAGQAEEVAARVDEWRRKLEADPSVTDINAMLPELADLGPARKPVWELVRHHCEQRCRLTWDKDSKQFRIPEPVPA